MKTNILSILLSLGILVACTAPGDQSNNSGPYELDRSILPIQPPPHTPVTIMDARDAEKPETFNVKAPEGAPNIVVVLIDDIGFGASTNLTEHYNMERLYIDNIEIGAADSGA